MNPLVTVICICYNHELFVEEALKSVWSQTYSAIQLIIVDDGSIDHSPGKIRELIQHREPQIPLIAHEANHGYTRSFNEALGLAKGIYVVDFAADDVMLPHFIERSVQALEKAGDGYGVCFTNAYYIDKKSKEIGNHNDILRKKKLIDKIPEGDIYPMVLQRYFICTPTMMVKKMVLDKLGGYDESLAYEDFDFWVRSSRYFKYTYIDEVLMRKRILPSSMAASQYKFRKNDQLRSTLIVCKKAFMLNKTKIDRRALLRRLRFELGHCITAGAFGLGKGFYQLLQQSDENVFRLLFYRILLWLKLDYRFMDRYRR